MKIEKHPVRSVKLPKCHIDRYRLYIYHPKNKAGEERRKNEIVDWRTVVAQLLLHQC